MRGILASRCSAVVAAEAIVGYAGMAERCRPPRVARVAGLAGVVRRDMGHALAGGRRAIVTTETASRDLRVIDSSDRPPGDDTMAALTGIARIDVRRVLAGGRGAVVAAGAITGDAGVIKVRGLPGSG